ncbi:LysE family translocator [Desulfobacula sp.]|uniref:LysE family translocator n=1 Tax=Desulfobacula sp. TaxID=2593537 RepID=UPI00260B90E3|nr:LysE family translocator [Desulfobacula sp.]
MSLLSIFSLAMALFVLGVTPGPGMFATISRSLASGFVPSLGVVAGIVTGDIIFLVFAILGLSFISQALGNFFVVVKIIGAAYLIFLGVKICMSKPVPAQHSNDKKGMKYGNYLTGLVITLSNPKVILFYCGFLPTFMDLSSLSSVDICIAATTVAVVLSSILVFYAYLANRAREFFSSTRSVRRLNRTAGGVMIAAGVAIAANS